MDNIAVLSSYRAVDLTDDKGMLCAKLLGDLGAEVIRIEKPRGEAPPAYANAGKHLLSLDIRTDKGKGLFRRLIKSSDIVVESLPTGYLSSLDLGYAELHRLSPKLIMTSITPFGQTGPYRNGKSSDIVACALGGPMYVCGEPHKPPLKPAGAQAYGNACLFAANGILLALWQRHNSNTGQYIDVSIHECLAAALDHVLVRYFYGGVVAERTGNLYWNRAFRVFSCRDGHILLSLFNQWETLVEWLDSAGMAEDLRDKKWLDQKERQRDLDHIIDVLGSWTQKHTVSELVEQGQLMRFPWANAASIPEIVSNSQLNDREFFVEAPEKISGRSCKYPGAPLKMSESPWRVITDLRAAGEYNRKIYQDEMGLTDAEISSLEKEGVI